MNVNHLAAAYADAVARYAIEQNISIASANATLLIVLKRHAYLHAPAIHNRLTADNVVTENTEVETATNEQVSYSDG